MLAKTHQYRWFLPDINIVCDVDSEIWLAALPTLDACIVHVCISAEQLLQ